MDNLMDDGTHASRRGIKEGFVGQRMVVLPPNIKHRIKSNPVISHLFITAIGYFPKAKQHDRTRKSGSSQYILIYCVEGIGYIYLGEICYTLFPNTYFIIPRNTGHRYYSDTVNPWSIYWLHFTGEVADQIFSRFSPNGRLEVQSIPYDENRIKVFEQNYSILEHSFEDKELEVMNVSLLHFICSLIYYREINPEAFNTDQVNRSISYMKKNIETKFRVEDLANQQHISVSHYSRLFKQKTGASPINYFNQLKIQKACQFLYFTEYSIKEICAQLGFDDPYYFSRLFKEIIGSAPSQYKKRHKRHL
ncbi:MULTISPECIES: AraC family transcriptional regulator [Pedobacter]|uniref:AraC family transcriptional regulator n=1 Tax=Pedobacter TaxID=84567 RepID=UPI00292F2435|nr:MULTISPECIES: AraC family transcriptional regulator [Pedobacter]